MRVPRPLPSQKYLCECFDYQPTTGQLTWRIRPKTHFKFNRSNFGDPHKRFNTQFAGQIAGRLANTRHRLVSISNIRYLESRIIFKMMTGRDAREIDHIDRDPTNNRWNNLREADPSTNGANTSVRSNNKLGVKCVRWNGYGYIASIKVNYRAIHLGTFATIEEARAAYLGAARVHWGKFASGG